MKLKLVFLSLIVFLNCTLQADDGVIVITCATSEIGGSTARLLAQDHDLLLLGRNKEKLEALQKELATTYSHSYTSCELDYSKSASVDAYASMIASKKVSGMLVITPRPQLDLLDTETAWLTMLQSCFTGPSQVLKATLASMGSKGKIVVISGITSVQVSPEYGAASVLRRMWVAYTKSLSHLLGPKGIRINCLSPGVIMTEHHRARIQKNAEKNGRSFEQEYALEVADTPLKRYAELIDVNKSIRFLLSDDSQHITGVNLVIDGGVTKAY